MRIWELIEEKDITMRWQQHTQVYLDNSWHTLPKVKYLGTNIIKYVEYLIQESYKILLGKEIKGDLNKWKEMCVHGEENSILLRSNFFLI